MDANTLLKLPISAMDEATLAATDPCRSNRSGNLFCGWCLHDIRLVCRTKTGVICADCGQNLDVTAQAFLD